MSELSTRALAERSVALSGVSLFQGLDARVLHEVAARAEELVAPAGAEVVRFGAPGSTLFIILGGRARACGANGVEISTMVAGEVFGELSALDPSPRSATVVAVDDLHLLSLHREVLLELLSERAELGAALLKTLSRRLRTRLSHNGHAVPRAGR